MYCSSCGVAVAPGLSYCNYCGAKLNGVKDDNVVKSSEVKPERLVAAMVFVFGLVAITLLMGMMKASLDLSIDSPFHDTELSDNAFNRRRVSSAIVASQAWNGGSGRYCVIEEASNKRA